MTFFLLLVIIAAQLVESYGGHRGEWSGWAITMVGIVVRMIADVVWSLYCIRHNDPVWGFVFAVIAGWTARQAWRHWKRRPPRQRRSSRVLGRIVDLGHRLAVVPAPSPA